MIKYDQVFMDYLQPSISDHSPLLINIKSDQQQGGRPFKFFNFLATHSQFDQVVTTDWCKPVK